MNGKNKLKKIKKHLAKSGFVLQDWVDSEIFVNNGCAEIDTNSGTIIYCGGAKKIAKSIVKSDSANKSFLWENDKPISVTTNQILKSFKSAKTIPMLVNACNESALYPCMFDSDGKIIFKACMKAYKRLGIVVTKKELKDIKDFYLA